MARVPGRDNRIAFPVLVLCLGIVGALVWFAVPAVPLIGAWTQSTSEGAALILAEQAEAEAVVVADLDLADTDCRELYPDDLWSELNWTTDALLAQSIAAPASGVEGMADALAPASSRTCVWSQPAGGELVTTFATVAEDAETIADAALRGQGFACERTSLALECTSVVGETTEHHMVAGTMWVATVESSWYPEDYDLRLAAHVWG